jgi:hypothetical protein
MAIIAIDAFVVVISLSPLYGWKHRPFEALKAKLPAAPFSHPASACCSGMLTIVIATTPSNASAAIIAITANVVLLFIFKPIGGRYLLRISATKLQNETFLWIIAS